MDQYSLDQRFQGALLGATIDLTPCLNWLCHHQQPPSLGDDPIANAIALLPLWLYTHESWRERQNRLEQILNSQPLVAERSRSALWLYGETIAQLLRPTCRPAHLLPSLTTRWQQHAQRGAPAFTPPWPDRLTQLHQWQQQRTPLHEVQTQLADCPDSERAITAALYCFVRSPDDWSIALRLATQFDHPNIGHLLGGLWGAYNGWTRFPTEAIAANPNAASQALLQAWSGRAASITTTPQVMGPR